jgi:serine/threonine protein kinase
VEPLRDEDPEQIGGHRLLALLGQGGWGNVYFARTGKGRSIALKTIRPDRLQKNPERFRKRFAREVEAAKAVDRKHTAEVVDSDTRAPEPWFATRYVAGVNLSEALDHCGSPLPLRTWRVLAAGLTGALRSIHSTGLVHRDLKLANILLAADGAYVIDFGIARHLSPEDGASLTGTGPSPQTPTFASPEQLRDERVGPAGDVFALGLVLAYTALNRHPFGTGSQMEIASNILNGRLSLDGLHPTVERVVLPCLEPAPANRPDPAEIAALLSEDASPNAKEWLPPGVRAKIDERYRFAIDTEDPLRPQGNGYGGPSPAWPPSQLTSDPTPVNALAAPSARRLRERDLPPAPPGQAAKEATTLPPPAARQDVRPAVKQQTVRRAESAAAAPPAPAPAAAPAPAPAAASAAASASVANDPVKAVPQAHAGEVDDRFQALAEAGNAEAMRRLAARHKSSGDMESALLWYRRAADSGNPTGAREAAQLLEKHFPDRRAQALALYRVAAEAGEDFAKKRLGLQQQNAPKTPKPDEKAAAKAGDKTTTTAKTVKSGETSPRGPASGAGHAPVSAAEEALLREHRAAAV